jgi:hypothetical protein
MDEARLTPSAPVTAPEAAEAIRACYGLTGELARLPGEADDSFLLRPSGGQRYVVKFAHPRADPGWSASRSGWAVAPRPDQRDRPAWLTFHSAHGVGHCQPSAGTPATAARSMARPSSRTRQPVKMISFMICRAGPPRAERRFLPHVSLVTG